MNVAGYVLYLSYVVLLAPAVDRHDASGAVKLDLLSTTASGKYKVKRKVKEFISSGKPLFTRVLKIRKERNPDKRERNPDAEERNLDG